MAKTKKADKPPVEKKANKLTMVLKEMTTPQPETVADSTFYLNKETGSCAFVDPFTGVAVVSSLDFLKLELKKDKPLTLKGVIDLAPDGSVHNGDFSGTKAFKIEDGLVVEV